MAKLFGENHTPLHSNGMAAIQKIKKLEKNSTVFLCQNRCVNIADILSYFKFLFTLLLHNSATRKVNFLWGCYQKQYIFCKSVLIFFLNYVGFLRAGCTDGISMYRVFAFKKLVPILKEVFVSHNLFLQVFIHLSSIFSSLSFCKKMSHQKAEAMEKRNEYPKII